MDIQLDHIFVCTESGAPEASVLIQSGLREGPSNQHPGQGTANRRFFFANSMIELLYVSDAGEARSEATARTRLWERWSGRRSGASPFGICVRPADGNDSAPPFPSWEYRPAYLPDPLAMHIADTGLEEPLWVYIGFARAANHEQRFAGHPMGVREITGVSLTSPAAWRSSAARIVLESGILSSREGPEHLLEVEFDNNRRKQTVDYRPHLPLVFRL